MPLWRCGKKSLPRIQRELSPLPGECQVLSYRQTTLTSLFGDVVYERVYHHCPHCQTGWFPMDHELRVNDPKDPRGDGSDVSCGHRRALSQAANTVVEKLSGLRVSGIHDPPHE